MVFSLPDVCESKGVVGGVIAQFQAGENSRSMEQGVGPKSDPQVRTARPRILAYRPVYALTTGGIRH